MPDPDGYTTALELFAKNLELEDIEDDPVLRNISAGLYHLAAQLQADMTAVKERVGVEFRLANRTED